MPAYCIPRVHGLLQTVNLGSEILNTQLLPLAVGNALLLPRQVLGWDLADKTLHLSSADQDEGCPAAACNLSCQH